MLYLVIAAGFAPSSFLLAKLTFCNGYQLISLMFTSSVHVPPFFSCFSSKFCVIEKGRKIHIAAYSPFIEKSHALKSQVQVSEFNLTEKRQILYK